MTRRTITRRGALAGGLAGLGGACNRAGGESAAVHTTERVRWKLASSFPSSLDTIYGAAEVLAERVAAMSGGNFTIRVNQAGEIVPALQVLDAVQERAVEVGQTAGYYYTGKSAALAFDTCVPFGLTSRQQTAWLQEGGGLELLRDVYASFGVVSFPCGNTGAQMGGWFREPVGSLADLRGLKMRIPGLGGKVMEALGVTAQQISGGEIYTALERGAIDATDWVGPYDDERLGFYKVAKHYHYPGWWEPGPSLSFLVASSAWQQLSADYQAIFRAASQDAAITMQARYDAKNPAALARLVSKGVQLTPFSDDLMRGAAEASRDMQADEARKDATYAALDESFRGFREGARAWFGRAELAYGRFVSGT
ncbi:MAG: TRAP transporter substrate-binding protein DctP [Planctomycetota bacterium]